MEVKPNAGDDLRIVASTLYLDNSALKSASTQSSDKKRDHVGNPSGDHRERKYRSTYERIRREIHQEFERLS